MAAGRGEFFQSFLKGLDRPPPGERQPGCSREKPGPGGGESGLGKRRTGARRKKRQPGAAPSSFSGNDHSHPEPRTERKRADFPRMRTSPSEENLVERLPSEILIKILSYLDASSLFCVSLVSKLFHQLANDDAIWCRIYMSEFGSQTWRPKSADDAALKAETAGAEDRLVGYWKKLYFRTMAGQEMNKWRRELRDISPYTGLPRRTEWVLRNLNVSWELTLCDVWGREHTLQQSRAYFFESSVIVRWSRGRFPRYRDICIIQLHGVQKEMPKSPEVRKLGWRSLVLKLDLRTKPGRFLGKDRLVKLMHVSPCFIVGIWRGQQNVAFVMVSLHFHKLVEKSLLGSPACPYSEPLDLPPVDNLDPKFGLHGYTLHFVLHNTGTEIMSGNFRQLSCCTDQIQRGLLEMRVISRTDLSQHRSLSGNITLPWKSEALEGSVENCCIITLTLLDEFQKPFWCLSSPICIKMVKRTLSFDYSGKFFLMEYQTSEGKVRLMLVWLKEQKQFFLISLTIYVPVYKVNKHFSREY